MPGISWQDRVECGDHADVFNIVNSFAEMGKNAKEAQQILKQISSIDEDA